MKTLFEFGSQLNSRDLNLALASLVGTGPLFGFNDGTINGTTLNIRTTHNSDLLGVYKHVMWDLVKSRFISQSELGGNTAQLQHGCISRDGYIYLESNENIQVLILNNRVVNNEVLLFANHVSVSEPIENPVNLVAYFNTSSNSFYNDYYIPQLNGDLKSAYNTQSDSKLNFESLENQAFNSIPIGNISKENSVLVGIYGVGLNSNTGAQEKFSIVPYGGQFPMSIPYNILIHKYISNLANKITQLEGSLDSLITRVNQLESNQ